jgi:hypothetical protein
MGSWGTGIFDNDSAADWASACASKPDLSAIERAFDALLDDDSDDPDAIVFVDADDAVHAVAAADALARLLGIERPTNAYCESLASWADENRESLALPPDLAERAIAALDAVLSDNCELGEMWAEDGRNSPSYLAWRASITDLRRELAEPAAKTAKEPVFRLDAAVRRAKKNERIVVPAGDHRLTVRPKAELAIVGQSAANTRVSLPRRLVITTAIALEDLSVHAEETAFEVAGGSLSLQRVNVTAGGSAVFVLDGGEASVRECNLSDESGGQLAVIEARAAKSQVSMEGGSVRGSTGVYLHDQARARLRNVNIVGSKAPAVRLHTASAVIERSELQGGESGLYLKDQSRAVVRACTLARSKLSQIEAYDSFVRVVGGNIVDGKDDGIDAHPGTTLEVESVRFRNNDIAVRTFGSRAKLLDVRVEHSRTAGVVAQDDAEIAVQGGTIHVGEGAALEAFDRGVIRARGVACKNDDDEPVLAYDDGRIDHEPPSSEPTRALDDVACWRLIALAREAAHREPAEGDLESRVAAHLVETLAQTDIPTITRFDHFLRERMAEAYRWDLWGVAYVMNGGCSSDGFDYFLGWLIGQGRERYSAALIHPDLAAAACTPEETPFTNPDLLLVGVNAYRQLTGSSDAEDFNQVYVQRVERTLKGTRFDEATIGTKYPELARFV